MTELAQLLGRLIRERGGYLPSHDDWLEAKAKEVESQSTRIRQGIVGYLQGNDRQAKESKTTTKFI